MLAIDKPPGLVVHPAPGHSSGTLVNALLHHVRDLAGIGGELRPGIVHRLDRDTSGVLLVAKTDRAHQLPLAADAPAHAPQGIPGAGRPAFPACARARCPSRSAATRATARR